MNREQADTWVERVAYLWDREAEKAGADDWRELSSGVLLNIAADYPQPRDDELTAPDEPGHVAFRVEAIPYHPGANGEDYHSGRLPAKDAAQAIRDIADRCERYWTADAVERPWTP